MRVSSFLTGLWLDCRIWLRVHVGLKMPARPGWRDLIAKVKAVDWYEEPGISGAPYAWSLFRVNPEGGPGIPYTAICIDTQTEVTAAPGPQQGGRCARCGLPVRFDVAGMRRTTDPPSCRACRRDVQQAWKDADT